MARSMISHSTLPESLWGEGIKTIAYILNRVPIKTAAKTLYEFWTGRKSSLTHFHIWECPSDARSFRPNEKKLDSKTVRATSLITLSDLWATSFMIPLLSQFLKQKMQHF